MCVKMAKETKLNPSINIDISIKHVFILYMHDTDIC